MTVEAAAAAAATAARPDGAGDRGIRRAAEAFEALFVQSLIRRMRESQLEDGFFGSGAGSGIYEGLFEQFLAEQVSARSPLGIADLLEAQWTRDEDGGARAREGLRALEARRAAHDYENVIRYGGVRPIDPVARPAPGVSRGYGWGTDPIDGDRKFHHGVDLPAPPGTPVRALAPGRVLRVARTPGYGLQVVVEHRDGLRSRYAHLSKVSVEPGSRLSRGQTLGRVGSSGRSTGPHLHFETLRDGRSVDPAGVARGPLRTQVLGVAADPER